MAVAAYNASWLCTKVRHGWYPKTERQWRRFWVTYARMLLTNDPRVNDLDAEEALLEQKRLGVVV